MRLNKFIAQSGYCSRRKADDLIASGQVQVNGKSTELGAPIDPEKDHVTINNETIHARTEFTLLMLHKPSGCVTTKADSQVEKTIYDCLPKKFHHLNPIGRLDKNTEGLLLLTDDGDLLQKMSHPKHGSKKIYQVKLKKDPTSGQLKMIEAGVDIEEEKGTYHTEPCHIRTTNNSRIVYITLSEGRNRQVRKMFNAIKCPVVYLKRIKMGTYELGDLKRGNFRIL